MFSTEPEKVNETIGKLIKNFDNYIDNFYSRLKINSIFNEFEDKARGDLMSLVNLSQNRYKNVKSGNSIQSVLVKQKPNYNQILNNVINDEFYHANEILSERKKFQKMNNNKNTAEINTLRQKIKENTRSLSNEENGGNLYETEGEYRIANLNFLNRLKNIKSAVGDVIIGRTNANRRNRKVSSVGPRASINESEPSFEGPLSENEGPSGNKLYSDLVLEDKENFEKLMECYQIHLNEIEKRIENENSGPKPQKFAFLTEDLKILNYKKFSGPSIVEKKTDDDTVEIKKIIKFTKNAQANIKKDNTSKKNIKGIDAILPSSEMMVEKGDFINIVKKEVVNSIKLEEIINKKRVALETHLKDTELPSLEDYQKVLLRNITTQKIAQQTRIAPKKKENVDSKPEASKPELFQVFKKQYDDYQTFKVKIEDLQQENLEKLDKVKRNETKQFLNKIKQRPRLAQQYVDEYSLREENINKEILDLNKYLGKQSYDKKRLNRKIDEFISELDRKNIEEKDKKKIVNKMDKDNEKILEIMRKNFNNEPADDVEVKFGQRENEIVIALVNSTKKNEKSKLELLKDYYSDFVKFRNKVNNKNSEIKEKDIIYEVEENKNNSKKSVESIIADDTVKENINSMKDLTNLNQSKKCLVVAYSNSTKIIEPTIEPAKQEFIESEREINNFPLLRRTSVNFNKRNTIDILEPNLESDMKKSSNTNTILPSITNDIIINAS